MNKILSGKDGEEKACDFIKKKGFKILERNYRCLFGEIDIIAKHKSILIFIEVKYRKTDKFGKGYESVTYQKQQKIIKTATNYISENNLKMAARFDVISIDNDEILHIQNAFSI